MNVAPHNKKAVLVIEDDGPIRGLLAELLADAGYEVLEAADGSVGLRLAQEHGPSVILLDLALPPTSGLDVLERLRTRDCTRYIPVVAMSGHHPSAVETIVPSPDGVIQKPFDIDRLLAEVHRMAALREAAGATPDGRDDDARLSTPLPPN
jgi:DNA-binding response OmpR family regulator